MTATRDVLLLLDYQPMICAPDGRIGRLGAGAEVARRGVLARARDTLAAFRAGERPVVHLRVAFEDDYRDLTSSSPRFREVRRERLLLDSDPATGFCEEVAPLPGEHVVRKGCVNPFVGTSLHALLVRLAATRLAIGGVTTNHVVEATARFGADFGYEAYVLEDLCAGADPDLHALSVQRLLPSYAVVCSSEEYLSGQSL